MGFKGRGGRNFSRNESFRVGGRNFGNRSFGKDKFDSGPPDTIQEFGCYIHPCQSQLVIKSNIEQVPYFNAPVYLENKEQIGKVDEIFGPIRDYSVSITLLDNYKSSSFPLNQKIFIDPNKLLPLKRFLPKPPENKLMTKKKGLKKSGDFGGGGNKRGGRGGRGDFGNRKNGGDRSGSGFDKRNSRGGGGRGGGGRGGGGRSRGGFRGRR